MNVDQFIIVYYLKKEVWGFESYSLSGTSWLPVELFCLVTKIFFFLWFI